MSLQRKIILKSPCADRLCALLHQNATCISFQRKAPRRESPLGAESKKGGRMERGEIGAEAGHLGGQQRLPVQPRCTARCILSIPMQRSL
jgi:hypothetical protein